MNLALPILLALASVAQTARILAFFPFTVKSHHFVFRPILEELGRRGHEVIYYTGYPYGGHIPKGIKQEDLSVCIPDHHSLFNIFDLAENTVFTGTRLSHQFGVIFGGILLKCPAVQELVHSDESFEAVLMESYVMQEYVSAFIHKFGAIGVEIIPLGDLAWMNELCGLPSNPSYQVEARAELTQEMNLWERMYNAYVVNMATLMGYYYLGSMEAVMDQYFNYTGWESRPSMSQLLGNRSLVLTNSHFAVGYPVPLAPNRVEVGGVNVRPTKPLPQEIQKFMDESSNGVIYFSLGSNINVSHPVNRGLYEVFIKVFGELPQRVLMKWEAEHPKGLPKNIKLGKWLPQQDVLAHNKCALFITHGGYLSLTEAVHFAVPVIGIPFFGDQGKNFRFVEEAGIGKMLRLKSISYETVSKAVREVLSDKRYKSEMLRRSLMLRDREQEPAVAAAYWIEHSLRHPNARTARGASLPYLVLHLIDLGLIAAVSLVIVVSTAWVISAKVWGICTRVKRKKVKSS